MYSDQTISLKHNHLPYEPLCQIKSDYMLRKNMPVYFYVFFLQTHINKLNIFHNNKYIK